MAHSISVKKAANTLLVVLFLGFILLPPLGMLIGKQSVWSAAEKRSLSLLPHLPTALDEITTFFASLDDYLDDHFGFREFFIHRYQRELDKRFNMTSSSSRVIKGLDGWYFFNEFNLLQDFLGLIPLKKDQLETWLARQQEKQTWLQSQGIRYLYMAIPNKQTIYPRYVMDHALARKGTTRFEQLREYTGNRLPDHMIDLHRVLRPEAFAKPLYFKNDSHWNTFGAYVAFREIMARIAAWFPQEEFVTDFAFGPDKTGTGGNTGNGGDLALMLMQRDLTETYPEVQPFTGCGPYAHVPYRLSNVIEGEGRDSFMRTCAQKNLRAVVFRDSFFVPLEPFLSENFREVLYLWKEYDQQNLEELLVHFKPDIVIEAVVERHVFDSLLSGEKAAQPVEETGRKKT
ncbi:MAG: AlgJ [uncultured bacterium]|nr:MAG: AlgJ [uncultured bacterium]